MPEKVLWHLTPGRVWVGMYLCIYLFLTHERGSLEFRNWEG